MQAVQEGHFTELFASSQVIFHTSSPCDSCSAVEKQEPKLPSACMMWNGFLTRTNLHSYFPNKELHPGIWCLFSFWWLISTWAGCCCIQSTRNVSETTCSPPTKIAELRHHCHRTWGLPQHKTMVLRTMAEWTILNNGWIVPKWNLISTIHKHNLHQDLAHPHLGSLTFAIKAMLRSLH